MRGYRPSYFSEADDEFMDEVGGQARVELYAKMVEDGRNTLFEPEPPPKEVAAQHQSSVAFA